MTTVNRRVLRLEHVARRRGGPPGGLCDDDRPALLNECGCFEYGDHRIVVADDAPSEVVAWLSQNAPDGYATL